MTETNFDILDDLDLTWVVMFNVTFNNISVMSWRSALLVEVMVMVFNATFSNISCHVMAVSFIGGGNRSNEENHRSVACH